MLRFESVTKVYEHEGKSFPALRGIDLTIEAGEIFGIIGLSGAGKSSLLRCVNLLERPTSGRIFIGEQELTTCSERELRNVKRKIGMVFQHFNLLHSKTVFDNVALPLRLARVPKHVIKERVEQLLHFVGLEQKAEAYPDQLSGGQKQRVGIARALVTEPTILLCDEATSALDPETTASILELLKQINQEYKITILLITHEMAVIRQICDRVAVLERGKLIEVNTVFQLFTNPQTSKAKNFISSVLHDAIPTSILAHGRENKVAKVLYRLQFMGEAATHPILSQLVKSFDVDVNVLYGQITELQGLPFGNLIIELQGSTDEVKRALHHIQQKNVKVKEVHLHARSS